MPDTNYCYPESDILINKLNIRDRNDLFEAEKSLTFIRLQELQSAPLIGNFDFDHLKDIHRYIFQDIYEWAGKVRTVEIGKGNLFCTTTCLNDFAQVVFDNYYPQCFEAKDDFNQYVKIFAKNYGDLNALHPFREGNGRAQREFARLVCLKCGYDFDLSCTKHKDMLEASILSFEKGDNSALADIFKNALTLHSDVESRMTDKLNILTFDDLAIGAYDGYDYYEYGEYEKSAFYDDVYKDKINELKNK